jgi:thiol-disulfide isomerase/thioredoxin
LTNPLGEALLQVMSPVRKHRLCGLLAAAASLWLFTPGKAAQVEPVVVQDLAGLTVNPFSADTARALVFVFLSVECPICNQYAPELNRLQTEFRTNGIRFELVYPDADETAEAIHKNGEEYGLKMEQVRDPGHALVRLAGARVTPEAAVFVPGRGFVYCGRIDNRYVKIGVTRPEATEHDLQDALRAVLKGQPIPKAEPAVGCFIPGTK